MYDFKGKTLLLTKCNCNTFYWQFMDSTSAKIFLWEDFEVVVVQIITRVHDPECEIITSCRREFAKHARCKKNSLIGERICTALAIQLRKRDSSASWRGAFVSPLKELAAINERSGRKSNWEIPAARFVGLFAGLGDTRGPGGGPMKSTYIRTVARKHLSSDTALSSLLTPASVFIDRRN